MSEFVVNTDMFGKYVRIPTGYSKEMHIYKVISCFQSNSYCDVPITYNSECEIHETKGLVDVLNVIHCGIDETKVIRVALKDCEIVNPKIKTNADRIRAMSDEELAKFMNDFRIYRCQFCGYQGEECKNATSCFHEKGYLEWLQKECD